MNGIPILLSAHNQLFDKRRTMALPHTRSRLHRFLSLLPTGSRNVGASQRFKRVADVMTAGGGSAKVLVIGGGTLGVGMGAIVDDPRLDLLETDVFIGPRTQVVCDAHELPFADGTFDGVICQAVLEHVLDPPLVAAEIHRVLREGGIVYSEIPFIQQVHEGPYDFTRFTHLGHRRLFRYFKELESGVQNGPGMALSWSIQYFFMALGGRSQPVRSLIRRITAVLTFWLTWLDPFLISRPGSIDAASGTFFLGQRQESPLTDSELVAGYRGTCPTPKRS